jgi:hypothetical protein
MRSRKLKNYPCACFAHCRDRSGMLQRIQSSLQSTRLSPWPSHWSTIPRDSARPTWSVVSGFAKPRDLTRASDPHRAVLVFGFFVARFNAAVPKVRSHHGGLKLVRSCRKPKSGGRVPSHRLRELLLHMGKRHFAYVSPGKDVAGAFTALLRGSCSHTQV